MTMEIQRRIVTSRLMGDPPPDLAARRAEAERRGRGEAAPIKTHAPIFNYKGSRA